MKNYVKFAVAAAVLAVPFEASAVTGDVIFNGTVSNTCSIVVDNAGSMTTNVGQTVLGSAQAGGAAGQATVTTTSGAYSVSIDAVTAFDTAPVGGGTGVTFATNYSGSGDTTIASTSGTSALNTGATVVSVNLAATKSSGSFPSGTYSATAVLRCE